MALVKNLTKEGNMRAFKFLIVFLVLAGIAFAQDAGEKKKPYTATVDPDGVQRITISGGSYFFEPDHIIVKVNVPVELTIKKESGIVPHNIIIINASDAGMDINESLSDKPKIIQLIPKKVGKYPFYCDKRLLFFKSHKEKGMEGVIEVVE